MEGIKSEYPFLLEFLKTVDSLSVKVDAIKGEWNDIDGTDQYTPHKTMEESDWSSCNLIDRGRSGLKGHNAETGKDYYINFHPLELNNVPQTKFYSYFEKLTINVKKDISKIKTYSDCSSIGTVLRKRKTKLVINKHNHFIHRQSDIIFPKTVVVDLMNKILTECLISDINDMDNINYTLQLNYLQDELELIYNSITEVEAHIKVCLTNLIDIPESIFANSYIYDDKMEVLMRLDSFLQRDGKLINQQLTIEQKEAAQLFFLLGDYGYIRKKSSADKRANQTYKQDIQKAFEDHYNIKPMESAARPAKNKAEHLSPQMLLLPDNLFTERESKSPLR